MRVLVAGASGAIGLPLVRALVEAGHTVTALTRSPGKQASLAALGATPAVADALDAPALEAAVREARPTHVIHELTALPQDGVRRARDLEATNRLRVEGTRNLLAAATAAGAARLIVGSFAPIRGLDPRVTPGVARAVAAVQSMESQVLDVAAAGRIEGIVLRYGLFYGPDLAATRSMMALARRRKLPIVRGDRGLLPWVHIADAVRATVAALDHGVTGSVYDIVDDRPLSMTEVVQTIVEATGAPAPRVVPAWLLRLVAPFPARMAAMRLPLSNRDARRELGWRPEFPTWRDGISEKRAPAA